MMRSLRCCVCLHPQAAAINRALRAKIPYRVIAHDHSVSIAALSNHRRKHLPAADPGGGEEIEKSPKCSICMHPDADAIDQALRANTPLRVLAREYSVSRSALSNHHRKHLLKLRPEKSLLETVRERKARMLKAQDQGLRAEKLRSMAALERIIIEYLKLERELLKEEQGQASGPQYLPLEESPEWVELRYKIVKALWPFPEAQQAVVEAIEGNEP